MLLALSVDGHVCYVSGSVSSLAERFYEIFRRDENSQRKMRFSAEI